MANGRGFSLQVSSAPGFNPGNYLTYRNPLTRSLLQQPLNQGTDLGGAGHVVQQLFAGLDVARDRRFNERRRAEEAEAYEALSQGLQGETSPVTGEPVGGGIDAAMTNLTTLAETGNPYAGRLATNLMTNQLQFEQQLDLQRQREENAVQRMVDQLIAQDTLTRRRTREDRAANQAFQRERALTDAMAEINAERINEGLPPLTEPPAYLQRLYGGSGGPGVPVGAAGAPAGTAAPPTANTGGAPPQPGAIPAAPEAAPDTAAAPVVTPDMTLPEARLANERARAEQQAEIDLQNNLRADFPKARGRMSTFLRDQETMLNAANRAMEIINNSPWATGVAGWASEGLPASAARRLENELEQIRSLLGFDSLQEMRANSPTGGALGNVSERENILLQAANEIGILDITQPEQLIAALQRVQEMVPELIAIQEEKFQRDYGQFLPQPEQPEEEPPLPGGEGWSIERID